jgi:hypothetical protein
MRIKPRLPFDENDVVLGLQDVKAIRLSSHKERLRLRTKAHQGPMNIQLGFQIACQLPRRGSQGSQALRLTLRVIRRRQRPAS